MKNWAENFGKVDLDLPQFVIAEKIESQQALNKCAGEPEETW